MSSFDAEPTPALKSRAQPANVVCVLGMHRSGTSVLTGSLQKHGLELGKHHTWNRHNKKGNRENQDIVDLHEQLLTDNGGSWDKPPKKIRWQHAQVSRAKEILQENADCQYWGFKDPRALLALRQWQVLVPDMQYIGIFRHPIAVATSLNKRGKIPIVEGVSLWYHYNRLLLKEKKKNDFPLLCFDWDEQEFHSKLEAAINDLGLTPLESNESFYTQDLHHHTHSGFDQLPWKVRRLYKKLLKLAY